MSDIRRKGNFLFWFHCKHYDTTGNAKFLSPREQGEGSRETIENTQESRGHSLSIFYLHVYWKYNNSVDKLILYMKIKVTDHAFKVTKKISDSLIRSFIHSFNHSFNRMIFFRKNFSIALFFAN